MKQIKQNRKLAKFFELSNMAEATKNARPNQL